MESVYHSGYVCLGDDSYPRTSCLLVLFPFLPQVFTLQRRTSSDIDETPFLLLRYALHLLLCIFLSHLAVGRYHEHFGLHEHDSRYHGLCLLRRLEWADDDRYVVVRRIYIFVNDNLQAADPREIWLEILDVRELLD